MDAFQVAVNKKADRDFTHNNITEHKSKLI